MKIHHAFVLTICYSSHIESFPRHKLWKPSAHKFEPCSNDQGMAIKEYAEIRIH